MITRKYIVANVHCLALVLWLVTPGWAQVGVRPSDRAPAPLAWPGVLTGDPWEVVWTMEARLTGVVATRPPVVDPAYAQRVVDALWDDFGEPPITYSYQVFIIEYILEVLGDESLSPEVRQVFRDGLVRFREAGGFWDLENTDQPEQARRGVRLLAAALTEVASPGDDQVRRILAELAMADLATGELVINEDLKDGAAGHGFMRRPDLPELTEIHVPYGSVKNCCILICDLVCDEYGCWWENCRLECSPRYCTRKWE